MSDTRYFGIALSAENLHGILGLPEDVRIERIFCPNDALELRVMLSSDGSYDGLSQSGYDFGSHVHFFRPDISTRKVSQVVIHPLKEK
jgi:hypothetical protein